MELPQGWPRVTRGSVCAYPSGGGWSRAATRVSCASKARAFSSLWLRYEALGAGRSQQAVLGSLGVWAQQGPSQTDSHVRNPQM